jgi:hypothetical protein
LSFDLALTNQSKKINPKTPKIPQVQIAGVTTSGIRFSILESPKTIQNLHTQTPSESFSTADDLMSRKQKQPDLYPFEKITTV